MKITNKFGFPDSIVSALNNDSYTKGNANISVTGLWKPPRIYALEDTHAASLEMDASESLWALLGKAVHEILSKADNTAVTEQRLFNTLEGWTFSGQIDRYIESEERLEDFKVTSAWSLVYESRNESWEQQLNTYAYLLREHGKQVNKLEIIAILRDHSSTEAKKNADYPQQALVRIPIYMWTQEEAKKKITERILMHQQAKITLPLCTESDQWAKAGTWAVMKPLRKSALRVFNSKEEAVEFMVSEGTNGLFIEERKGSKIRCESYCNVKDFCDQYKMENINATVCVERA